MEEREHGDVIKPLRPYGVGIDTHKEFIQVCVLVQRNGQCERFEREFQTSWPELLRAKDWAATMAFTADGDFDRTNLRYTIESTGCYHVPVLLAWQGTPSVVNPVLAGHTRRKTDVLDARMLAHHGLVGMWPESFIASRQGEVLRCLLAMRNESVRFSTRCTNRINNHLLRFGHTIGREHAMADMCARGLVEDLLDGRVPVSTLVCPDGIPESARPIFRESYKLFDQFKALSKDYHKKAIDFIKTNKWPTGKGEADGDALLKKLQTVPGVGEVSAMTWLSVIIDPRRFQVPAQVAAFCGADPSLKVSAGKVTSHTKRKGNARLHHVLKNVAAQLVRRHDGPLGQWGYGLMRRHAKGGWGRSINAVSRRLALFLWRVHLNNDEFSYEQYKFMIVPQVIDLPVEEMDIHQRYKNMLAEAGLTRTGDVARAFLTTLPQQKGIGAGCLKTVKLWLEQNRVEDQVANQPLQILRDPMRLPPTSASSSAESSPGVEKKTSSSTKALPKPKPSKK